MIVLCVALKHIWLESYCSTQSNSPWWLLQAALQGEESSEDQDGAMLWGRASELTASPTAQAAAAQAAVTKQVLVSTVSTLRIATVN